MNQPGAAARRSAGLWTCLSLLGLWLPCGCSRESTRLAIEAQRRADQVQQTVFDRQHEALCVLLYRDLLHRLETAEGQLLAEQRELLSQVWNDRDLIEFWAVQNERAKALRLLGVDAKLFSDQSVVDLLWKSLQARADRARQGLAAYAAELAVEATEP